jgi:catechol 2,3-dioxygenase-like lactoylglutathione lyase family enzyme
MKIRHIGILVDDLDGMKDFYMDIFGMKVLKEQVEDKEFMKKVLKTGTEVKTCKLIKNDLIIELVRFAFCKNIVHERIDNIGINHFALTVDDLGQIYKEYKNYFLSAPQVNQERTCKVAFLIDPENNYIELVESLEA